MSDTDNFDIDNDTVAEASNEDQELDTLAEPEVAIGDDEEADDSDDLLLDGDEPDEDGEDGDSVSDDVLVTMSDGTKQTLAELKRGFFRAKDYTHKTEAVAQERKTVEAIRESYNQNAAALQQAYQRMTQFVESLVPPAPPLSLAQNDPGAYQYQMALRNSAIAELQDVYQAKENTDQAIQGASAADIARYKAEEEAKLLAALPALRDPSRKAAFDAANKKTAIEFGFTENEIMDTADHRILQFVHYARIGKLAEQNRKNAGRRVAEKPQSGARPSTIAATSSQKIESLRRRAEKTQSVEDAARYLRSLDG